MTEITNHTGEMAEDSVLGQWERPTMLNPATPEGGAALQALKTATSAPTFVDKLPALADELYEVRNPSRIKDKAARKAFVDDILAQEATYGMWFHFEDTNQVVRYLRREDHTDLHTSRYKNVISAADQRVHNDATVGIWGLSVGSNTAIKIAQNAIAGKVLLADFDVISPSNLGRMDADVRHIGMAKLDFTAWQISHSNPYIEQVHFREGITPDNIDEFFGHNPNVVTEAVDSFYIKALTRVYAARYKTPLIMGTDLGRIGMVDVERHDLGAKPFGGRISVADTLALARKELTNEQIGKLMLRLVGVRRVSPAMLDSASERGKTLVGLPQLGTTAAMVGASIADTASRIILGHNVPSGRTAMPDERLRLTGKDGVIGLVKAVARYRKAQQATA